MDQYRYGPRKWTKKQRQSYEARKKLKNRKRGRPVARWAFDRDYLARRVSWKDRPNWVRRKLRLAAKHVLLFLTYQFGADDLAKQFQVDHPQAFWEEAAK